MVVCCQISLRKANQEAVWWPRGLKIQLCHPCAWGAVAGSVPGSGIFTCCRHGQKKEKEKKKRQNRRCLMPKLISCNQDLRKWGRSRTVDLQFLVHGSAAGEAELRFFYGLLYVGIKNKCTVLYTHCCLQKVVSFLLCLIYFKKVTVLT